MKNERPVLILGLGNTILTDDGVGVYAARKAREILRSTASTAETAGIDVKEAELAGFGLLDLLDGYTHAVIVDALHSPDHRPGEIIPLSVDSFTTATHLTAGHEIDLPTALRLGKKMGQEVPEEVAIIGVRIADDLTLSEKCTPEVEAAIEPAALLALEKARAMRDRTG